MEKIPLMDLTRQYRSIEEELNTAVHGVMASGQYILGEEVSALEREFAGYCGTKYAAGVGNGTDALVIALKAIGIKPGDEVITCAMSFFATAEAVVQAGGVPVFVDCTPDTYTIDTEQIEEKITGRTKAILPVHLYGQCAGMDRINEVALKHGLYVVEDAAEASGAEYKGKKAGSLGDIACFSFFPTKNLGCAGDGGIILTDNESLYRKCRAYRVHGSGKDGLFTYEINNGIKENSQVIDFNGVNPKYYNFTTGYNSRLDALQAAILRVKLKYLDVWNKRRRDIASRYDSEIDAEGVVKPETAEDNRHIYYVYILQVDDRKKFREHMNRKGISTGVYFPVPLHLQKAFEHLGYRKGDMPNAERLAEHNAAIPMFAELTENEVTRIIETVNCYGKI